MRTPGRRRLIVALVLVAATTGCSGPPAPVSPTPAPTGLACRPQVVDSGFGVHDGVVAYALVVANMCPTAAVRTEFDVAVLDANGARIDDPATAAVPDLPVIRPGQNLAVAGRALLSGDSATPASLGFELSRTTPVPDDVFAGWPDANATAVQLTGPDAHEVTTVTVDVSRQPATAALCNPWLTVIARDGNGRIVYGNEQPISRQPAQLLVPGYVDPNRIALFVIQGQRSLGDITSNSTGLAYIACRT